ncbi:pyridoxamine 5'-phosphate oxidase family protein [Methylomonas methanica]|uniref:Pyridoxamine 5'-phosphate oxidase-related FMN-binding protein n=1 Tax=Methylomonas methanica (strain DSM 25384 / MC09) TaxID=857087 RepID=G0A7S5_METMM|nr:pyridoxamine 5'-phosphate oxidase family protein [Methylomonas methanica]AEG01918.1 pyridoxamine 5'-phosphate oxidase-related FMN-binding protein [Methylomonas methanica MC09]
MARAFAKISFTPDVQAVQTEMGSRAAYRSVELGAAERVALSPGEQAFIAERDSFYLATVSQNGWPYVQHRGGPAGFLKVLDEQTIGYAEFSGNRQYLSVGNLRGDDRVSMILMDYPQQGRLKIWGRAREVDARSEPELLARLEVADSRAPVERGIVIRIEAFDWNCPKYITPRYNQREVETLIRQTRAEFLATEAPDARPLGTGELPLTVSGIRQLTPRIRAYELSHAEGEPLPGYRPGAHIRVPIRRSDGSVTRRAYSLTDAPDDAVCYRIAVLRVDDGEGGSVALHDGWRIGDRLNIDKPDNYFQLHDDARPALLIGGGIGITPIKAMAEALAARGADFQLHYSGRTQQEMAFVKELRRQFADRCRFYFSQAQAPTRLDVEALLAKAAADAVIYVCGPARLIASVRQTARRLGIADERVQFESFV